MQASRHVCFAHTAALAASKHGINAGWRLHRLVLVGCRTGGIPSAVRPVGTTAADAAASAATKAHGAPQPDGPLKRAGKRKVALFIGYEGTEYRGLQMQHSSAPSETVEDALEEAIFRIGGILPSNRGHLGKVGWSRSSRTDKSVHSLATVVGLKMEVDGEAFEADPEGQQLAAAVNSHLPPEVRVFSIQRVSKSWNARSECIRRSYAYHLPASMLGLVLDGGEADRARLQLLCRAWESFQGTYPFHNYTKRRLYREPHRADMRIGSGRRGKRRQASGFTGGESCAEEEEGSEGWEEGELESHQGLLSASGIGSSGIDGNGSGSDSSNIAVDSGLHQSSGVKSISGISDARGGLAQSSGSDAGSVDGSSGSVRKGQVQLGWKAEKDNADLVVRRHFRFIEWCRVGTEVKPLVPGGQPCVTLSLQGGSFMLHQIRKMVGMVVAVARGHLPLELLEASLAIPARVNVPLAPPSTLVLTGAQFSPFKRSWSGEAAAAAQWTGEVLQLREQGAAAQQRFLHDHLLTALDSLLAGEEWRQWEQDLERLWYDDAELCVVLEAYRVWAEQRQAAKLDGLLQEARGRANPDEC